jgi:hypothetical protein
MKPERCRKLVANGGGSARFHQCLNDAVTKAGYCRVHDPELREQRRAKQTKCAYVNEETGKPDCSIIVRGTKYCQWHGESVLRARVYTQAAVQGKTLEWAIKQKGGWIEKSELIRRLTVSLKNT